MTPDAPESPEKPHVLVTGATAHIGGRLVPVLESAGVRLRCLARQPLASRVSPTTEIVAGDLLDPASLDRALTGIDVAYYLVHSTGAHGDYHDTDRVAARNFGEAARRACVRRIVYLGGLATGDEALSRHLSSRMETGQALRDSGVPRRGISRVGHDDVTFLLAEFVEGPPGPALWHGFKHRLLRQERR